MGNVWFDGLSLSVGNRKISSLGVAPGINETEITELVNSAKSFKNTRGSKAGQSQSFTDLTDFKRIAGNARILALGECTHGTGDFFAMKHRLLECAVKEMGFRIFALEANQLNVELINHYVRTGEGGLEKLMAKSLFAVWNTQEVFDMIEWVRWYNSNNPADMILFQGYDMQDPSLPIDSLVSFVSRHSPALQQQISVLLRDYRMAWKKQDYLLPITV